MAYEKHTARAPKPSHRPAPVEDADRVADPSTESEPVVRTPQPKVLARIPQADSPRRKTSFPRHRPDDGRSGGSEGNSETAAPTKTEPTATEPTEAPKGDRLPGFDGRMINQRLATRILIGGAVALLLVAIVPLAFRGNDQDQDQETASSDGGVPTWTPENPAPDASAAPSWKASPQSPPGPPTASVPPDWPGAPGEHGDPADLGSPTWTTPEHTRPAGDRQFSQDGGDHYRSDPYADQGHYQDARSSANRSQSLPAEDVPGGPVARQADHRAGMPDAHAPAGGYDGQYEAAQPYPAYRQAYRPERPRLDSSTPAPRYGEQPAAGRDDWRHESSGTSSNPNHGSRYDPGHDSHHDSGYDSGEYTPIQPPPKPEPDRRVDYSGTRGHRVDSYPNRNYADDRYRSYNAGATPPASYAEPTGYPGTASYDDGGPSYAPRGGRYAPASPGQDAPYRGNHGYGGNGSGYEPAAYEASPSAANAVTPAARFRGDIERPAVNATYDDPRRGLY